MGSSAHPNHRLYGQSVGDGYGECSCGWKSREGIAKADAREQHIAHFIDEINNGPGNEGNIDPFSIPASDPR